MSVYLLGKPKNNAEDVLDATCFANDEDAIRAIEHAAWRGDPTCPHCAHVGPAYDLRKTRIGLKKCRKCRMQFTVRVGTMFEGAHLAPHKWLQAIYLLTAGSKPISALKLSHVLGISYKSSWLLARRVRAALHASGPSTTKH